MRISRRAVLARVASGAAAASLGTSPLLSQAKEVQTVQRKGRIRQSVSRWCYEKMPLEALCEKGVARGLKGIDLLSAEEWEVPGRYGLVCSMGYGGGGEIRSGMNRVENHAKIEASFRKSIPRAAKLG